MAGTSTSELVGYGAGVASLAIAISRFVAAFLTGSSAMLSEVIHALADSGNGVLLSHGVEQAEKPAVARHPFRRIFIEAENISYQHHEASLHS